MRKKVIIIEIVLAILIFLSGIPDRYYFATISSNSMMPTLMVKDTVLVDKKFSLPLNSGDIIAYSNPKNPNSVRVHRVIARGGDTVEFKQIDDDRFSIFVDGKELNEPYLGKDCKYFKDMNVYKTFTVPEYHYYVLGDNRQNAYDSRLIGFISILQIKGKAIKIIGPIKRQRDF